MRPKDHAVLVLYAVRSGPHNLPPGLDDPETFRAACDVLADICYTDCEAFGYESRMDGDPICGARFMAITALSQPGLAEPVRALLQAFLASLCL